MKSIVYEITAPYKLVEKEMELRESELGPTNVLAETEYTMISTGTEIAAWEGKPPLRPSNNYPRLVGYCNLARVKNTGEAVSGIRPGDHILTHQSHRSSFICDISEILLCTRDSTPTLLKYFTSIHLYHIGYSALLDAGFQPGIQVGIIGMGTLGMATANLIKSFGSEPLVFTNQNIRNSPIKDLKLTHVFPKECPNSEEMQRILDMDGVDISITTSNSWEDYELALKIVRKGGKVICIGFPGRGEGLPGFNPLDSAYLYDKQITLCQAGYRTDLDVSPQDMRFTLKRNYRYLASLIENGAINPSHIINIEADWTKLEEIYKSLSARSTGKYSALLSWQS